MKIYTGTCGGESLQKCKDLDVGIMVSPCPTRNVSKDFIGMSCAIDNGAFRCYQKGYPFMADQFRALLKECYDIGVKADFIVCHDIVCQGRISLSFSMKWAMGELLGTPNLALVVQDGMGTVSPGKLPLPAVPSGQVTSGELDYFTHIFVGGSQQWKWATAKHWIKFAHDNGKKCHIGQCGKLDRMKEMEDYGADSIDSVNFVRNGSFDLIEQLHKNNYLI